MMYSTIFVAVDVFFFQWKLLIDEGEAIFKLLKLVLRNAYDMELQFGPFDLANARKIRRWY